MQPQKSVDATKVLNKAIIRAAHHLNLTQKELSQIIGSSKYTATF